MKAKERQVLKHDRFVETLLRISVFLQRHRRVLTAAAVAAIVAVGAALWIVSAREAASRDRRLRLYTLEREMESAAREPEAAARREALDRVLGRLRLLYDEAPRTAEGRLALLLLAEVRYGLGDYARAVEAYRAARDAPGASEEFRALVERSLATALEQTQDWAEAATLYRRAAARASSDAEKARAWLDCARCLDRMERFDEANEARVRARDLAPGAVWADVAALDSRLAGKPEATPAPTPEGPTTAAASGDSSAVPAEAAPQTAP